MWYFLWIVGVGLAAFFAMMSAMGLEGGRNPRPTSRSGGEK